MKERLLHTPEGVRDIYNSECARKVKLEEKLHHTLRLYGFEDIQTPTFEFFEVFSEERGTVSSRNMYKFFDREGNTLVLRPDMTPSIARCVAKYYSERELPLRLCYSGNTFINSLEYQGKLKESTQLGAELVNDSSVEADAEMLALTVSCLKSSGLEEFQVEVGHTGFFRALVEEAAFSTGDISQLKELLENKNVFGIEAFLADKSAPEDIKAVLSRLPELFGSVGKLADIRKLTKNENALRAIDRLETLYNLMDSYGFRRYISFDLGMLSQYEYYTGIIFHAYTYGTGDAVVSGGRYDSLIAQFGKDAPAIGMAIYIDRLMSSLARQKLNNEPINQKLVLIYESSQSREALAYAHSLREKQKHVETAAFPTGTDLNAIAAKLNRECTSEIKIYPQQNQMEE